MSLKSFGAKGTNPFLQCYSLPLLKAENCERIRVQILIVLTLLSGRSTVQATSVRSCGGVGLPFTSYKGIFLYFLIELGFLCL